MDKKLRIVFLGTPEFAVASLSILLQSGYTVVGVVTSPDKQAGRGLQWQQSPVKKFAIDNDLPILQPEKLKDPLFLAALKSWQADLQIVVAFRMLPEIVWNMPPMGTINLHASLLPQYRGAAPINHVIMNGETETGVTTFFLQHEIDTGDIILFEKVPISSVEDAGDLHNKLMNIGAHAVLETVKIIESGNFITTQQPKVPVAALKTAPKIFKDDCRIPWNRPVDDVYNHIRGLSPYPSAYTELISPEGALFILKIGKVIKEPGDGLLLPGTLVSDGKTVLKIAANNGWIRVEELQLQGRKRMNVKDFLRGFSLQGFTVKN